jgi:hypothetical protein
VLVGCVQLSDLDDLVFDDRASAGAGGATASSVNAGGMSSSSAGGGATAASGGSGGSAGGGGGPEGCGTVSFEDDFDPTIGNGWNGYAADQSVQYAAIGGELVLTAQVGSNAVVLVSTISEYDFTLGQLSVELSQATDASTAGHLYFSLTDAPSGGYVAFRKEASLLKIATDPSYAVLYEVIYDEVMHRHLRFRRDGATTHAETSPNGQSWSPLYSFPQLVYFEPNAVRLLLGMDSDGDAMEVHFDNARLCH